MPERPSVLFVGSFPPPYTGQTVATASLANVADTVADVYRLSLADPNRHQRASGRFSAGQMARVRSVVREIRHGPRYDVGYLTLASSLLGRARDLALVGAMRPRVDRLVVHVHQGSFGPATTGGTGLPSRIFLRRWVDRWIFLTSGLAAQAHWVPEERVRIVPNPTGRDVTFSAAEAAEQVAERVDETELRVLFLANMMPGKGHLPLLEALPAVRSGLEAARTLRVDLVGAWGSQGARRTYEERARALGVHDVLRIHGGVEDRTVVRGFLAAAHVLAFPSTYATEALPLAVVEALGAGTPVVATRHAGLADLVDHDGSGLLVDAPPRPERLARAILQVLAADTWPRLARGARTAYETRFTASVVRRAFLSALLDDEAASVPAPTESEA